MSSEPPARTPTAAEVLAADLASAAHPAPSKKQQQKDARRAEKAAAAAQHQRQQHAHAQADAGQAEEDPSASNYGDVPAEETQSKAVTGRSWTRVRDLGAPSLLGRSVLVRGFVQSTRSISKTMAFLVLRQGMATVQVRAGRRRRCRRQPADGAVRRRAQQRVLRPRRGRRLPPQVQGATGHHTAGSSFCPLLNYCLRPKLSEKSNDF